MVKNIAALALIMTFISCSEFSGDKNEGTKGAYINGNTERLEGENADVAFAMVKEKFGSLPLVFENTSPYRVKIGQINSSKSSENRWYFYS